MAVKVLIAGYGKLGTLYSDRLSGTNDTQVYALSRSSKQLPNNTQLIRANLLNEEDDRYIGKVTLPSVDYLFFTATPDSRTEPAYRDCYITALKQLCKHLDVKALKHFFFVSSTSVYGENSGDLVTENSPENPTGFSGKIILEAEEWLRQQPFPTTCVRFGGIYGGSRNMLVRQVIAGKHLHLKNDAYTNRIHEYDCAGIMDYLVRLCMENRSLAEIYNAVDGSCALKSEVYNFLAEQLSVAKIEIGERKIQGKRCSNQKLLETGYCFQYQSFRDGYLEMLTAAKDDN